MKQLSPSQKSVLKRLGNEEVERAFFVRQDYSKGNDIQKLIDIDMIESFWKNGKNFIRVKTDLK